MLEAIKDKPVSRRLVQFQLKDTCPRLYHDEPVSRNGVRVGYTTSASFGHYLGSSVGMGYVEAAESVTQKWIEEGDWSIDVAGKSFFIEAQLAGFYDPSNKKMKN